MKKFILFWSLLHLTFSSAKGLSLDLNLKGFENISSSNSIKLRQFLENVSDRLPLKFKKLLNTQVQVSFSKKFSTGGELAQLTCDSSAFVPGKKSKKKNKDILGKYIRGKGIILNYYLIKKIISDNNWEDSDYGCDHRSYKKLAVATMIHELSHAFDAQKINETKNIKLANKCRKFKKKYFLYPSKACEQRARENENISDLIQYRHLSGWSDKGLLFPSSSLSHHLVKRSPLPYEYKTRQEHFPVNMEFFLLDPEYKCRRPALYQFFSKYFEHTPFPKFSCQVNTYLKLNNIIDKVMTSVDLKNKTIQGIHYLYAKSGSKLSQKLGTGMFRVILCDRSNTSSKSCVKDSDDDIVFSYKKTGKKLITVDVQSMMEIKYQYNDIEFRDLYSLPIKLDKYEQEIFFYQLLSDYWEFTGKYYLGGGTISTELIRPIKGAIVDYSFYSAHPLSPKGLYRELVKSNLVDRSVFSSLSNPELNGYIFLSRGESFELMFNELKNVSTKSKVFKSFNYYINKSNHGLRKRLFNSIKFKNDQTKYYYLRLFNELNEFIFMKESYLKNYSKKQDALIKRHSFSSNKLDYGIPFTVPSYYK